MKRRLLGALIALLLVLVPAAVSAANTADVTITASPEYIGIAITPSTWNPSVPDGGDSVNTTTDYFSVNNTSNIATHNYIYVTGANWTSTGVNWTHSDTATSGNNTVGLYANKGGTWGVSDVIVKYEASPPGSANILASSQTANTDWEFGLALIGPTTNEDTASKSNTVRVMSVCNPRSGVVDSKSQVTMIESGVGHFEG